jgi:hypothetical protein
MKFPPDLAAVLAAFGEGGVRYLLIGGHAVGVHARPRSTKDLDLWLDHDPANVGLACRALAAFGAPRHIVEDLRTAQPDEIVWMGRAPSRIDFLFTIPGISFRESWRRRVEVELDGVRVHVIGKDDLIANKRATGRPQDRRDVRAMEGTTRAKRTPLKR